MWTLRVIFWPLEVDFLAVCGRRIWALVGDPSTLGVDFGCLVVKCGTPGVVTRPLEVDFRRLRVKFRPLVVDYGHKKLILGHSNPNFGHRG